MGLGPGLAGGPAPWFLTTRAFSRYFLGFPAAALSAPGLLSQVSTIRQDRLGRHVGYLYGAEPGHSDEAILLDLNRAYTHLFIMTLNPMESVNRGEGQLWGDSTVAVQSFMDEAGLAVEGEVSLLPDHIAMELEIMRHLTKTEAVALDSGDLTRAAEVQALQRRFVDEHLRHWALPFFGSVERLTTHPFYAQVAVLARNFLYSEEQALLNG